MLDKAWFLSLSPTHLINSIKHEHSYKVLYLQVVFLIFKIQASLCCCEGTVKPV